MSAWDGLIARTCPTCGSDGELYVTKPSSGMETGESKKEAVDWWASIQEDRQAWGIRIEESHAHNFSFSLGLKFCTNGYLPRL